MPAPSERESRLEAIEAFPAGGLVSVIRMVVRSDVVVDPGAAAAMGWRREPGPLSAVLTSVRWARASPVAERTKAKPSASGGLVDFMGSRQSDRVMKK